jgi:photosystem II stability/assembly factor-like uncharacterized protein
MATTFPSTTRIEMQFNKRTFHTLLLTLVLGASAITPACAGERVTLHVHGLSYSADGKRLMIPSHHGLAVFENGRWSKADGPAHDYMGFSAARDALYSSGHPAPGTGLVNPFGLIKSGDGGKTWTKLGLEGESDFHLLATSYATNAVYVLNHGPNSRMSQPGVYHTRNDGLQWTRAAAKGLGGDLKSLAVHPSDAGIVAAGTADGLYLSRNSGETFERLAGGQPVVAASFDLDGQHLWFSTYAGKASLMRLALSAGAKPQALPIPPLAEDAVAYIAQNPARRDEMAIATFQRSVFLSKDQGRTWTSIARNGETRSQ